MDIDAMVALTQEHFEREADTIFRTDPLVLAYNLTLAIVRQFYRPGSELLLLAESAEGLLGYVWVERGQRAVWSDDEMIAVKLVHVDLRLSARTRLKLCSEMIRLWEDWAGSIGVPIVCSTTMRGDQEGFLRLHERHGYERRGSICYKRLKPEFADQGTDHAN